MATNGCAGFRKGGVEKLDYQHGDGWIKWMHHEGLGASVIHVIQLVDTSRMIECFDKIEVNDNVYNGDESLDLSYFITGRKTYMGGNKHYTDYDYILDLDKEVLEYRHHNHKFDIDFSFIRSNQLYEIMEFITAKELETEFDKLGSKLENEISSALNNNHNNFYLGPDGNDLLLKSEKIENEEDLQELYEEYANDEDKVKCVFIYHSGFKLIESFNEKIISMIERIKASHKIEIAVTTYYSHPW